MISDINKETGAMGLIHVYYAAVAPCDDPEDQLEYFHRVMSGKHTRNLFKRYLRKDWSK